MLYYFFSEVDNSLVCVNMQMECGCLLVKYGCGAKIIIDRELKGFESSVNSKYDQT